MSKLQSPMDYEREIAELDRLIRLEEAYVEQHGRDFAAELSLHSLRARRESLLEELEALGDERLPQQELAVVFEGRPVHDHAVDATFLSTMLRDLQRVVENIVASAAGSTGRTGRVAQDIRERSTLRFAGSFAGSFGMRLETAAQELALEDTGSIVHTLDQLVRLLESDERTSELLGAIAPLTARARASYMTLLDHLSESRADMRVTWRSARRTRSARLTAQRANRILSKLRHVDEKETLQSYPGILDGAIKTRGFFEFRTEDQRVMAGEIAPNVIPHLRDFFDQPCVALITTREVTDRTTGDRRTFHRLEQLTWPEEEVFAGE
jgi:hypothetical protein